MRAAVLILVMASPALADHALLERDIAAGATLYQEHCAACHGVNLEGQPDWRTPNADGTLPAPPHDETGHTWHHGDDMLFNYTYLGGQKALEAMGVRGFTSAMPGFAGVLSPDEVWDILGYIRSTWPESAQEVQASKNAPHG